MDHHLQTNLEHWNELTPIHARSAFYDLKGFRTGKSSLKPIEIRELGDVTAKSLLHLPGQSPTDVFAQGGQVSGMPQAGDG